MRTGDHRLREARHLKICFHVVPRGELGMVCLLT
jgi:hypothetical protein